MKHTLYHSRLTNCVPIRPVGNGTVRAPIETRLASQSQRKSAINDDMLPPAAAYDRAKATVRGKVDGSR
jgi:hypothetical protein